jgi:hypothetical protein
MRTINVFVFFCCAAAVFFNSCLGASADISIRADGSGTIALEYRVSQMLESIGRLDGNVNKPAVPVSKSDFERSLAAIPGMKLSSFSAKNVKNSTGGSDLLTKAALTFDNTDALLAFLGGSGGTASLAQENGKNLLRMVMLEPSGGISDADLISLLRETSDGYEIGISLSAPKNASLAALPNSVPSARLVSQGKKVSFAAGLADLVGLKDGLLLEIRW